MNPLRALLNKHRWTTGIDALSIDYDFRVNGEATTATANGDRIEDISTNGLTLSGDERETFLPYHRISQVREGEQIIYERRSA